MNNNTFLDFVSQLDTQLNGKGNEHRKVFISQVYDAAREQGMEATLPEFKAWLLEQMQAGQVVLSRCDLPYAFDQSIVTRSHMKHINADFHLIRYTYKNI